MNGRSHGIFRIIIILLAICLIYLLFTVIQSLDRLYLSNRQILKQLENLKTQSTVHPRTAAAAVLASGNIANSEYFDQTAPDGGKLVSILSNDAPGLNPLTVNEATSRSIFSLCSSSLAERDWQNPEIFKPLMAESWKISDDHLTYRVKLRDNMMWQGFTDPETGKKYAPMKITAADFKFTVDTIKNIDVDCSSLRVYYNDLVKVEIINDLELEFIWSRAYYGSLESTLSLFPLPRHFYAPDGVFDGKKFNTSGKFNRMLISCGPYQLDTWRKDRKIILKRNPLYFGNALGIKPPINVRELEIIKHPNTQFQALIGGKVDMMSLSAEQWTRRTDIPEFKNGTLKRFRYSSRGYSYIGYNHKVACFKDRLTRQALTRLIDRKRILQEVMYGCGKVINGPFFPESPYVDPDLKPIAYAPEEAKKLLAQAGWRDSDGDGILERDGKKFEFTMLQISGSSTQARILAVIKESFAAAGIDMKLQTVEWSVYIERLNKRNFEACNLGWTGSIDPDPYQIFHSSQIDGGDNFISYKNPELDKGIEQLRQEFDMKKRIEICRKLEKILYDDQPYTFMFCPDALVAVRDSFGNLKLFPNGLQPISFFHKTSLK